MSHLTRSDSEAFEQLDRLLAENNGKELIGDRRTQGDECGSHRSWCKSNFLTSSEEDLKPAFNHGRFRNDGHVEHGSYMVEH